MRTAPEPSVALGDLNKDGRLDLVSAQPVKFALFLSEADAH